MMKRGMTLVELLVVILITSVIGAGVFIAYRDIVRKNISSALVAKDEQSAMALMEQVLKDVHSVGFGIWNNPQGVGSISRVYGNNGNITCNSLNSFATTSANAGGGFVAIAKDCVSNGDELYFFSVSVRDHANSGCWGYVDEGGCLNLGTDNFPSRNYIGSECNANSLTGNSVVVLDGAFKGRITNASCSSSNSCPSGVSCSNAGAGALVFYTGNDTYPNSFAVRYYLSTDNQPRLCAPYTYSLYKHVYGSTPQPIISCVGAFKVRYIIQDQAGNMSYLDSLPTSSPPLGIRVCMLLQVGDEVDTDGGLPSLSTNCGSINANDQWRFYRWQVIELDVPIRNR